jgi:hypothetical protein
LGNDRDTDLQQDLAQFEPDPDGDGQRDPAAESAALARGAGDDSGQWIAWPDESGVSAWAAQGLRELTGKR